MSAMNRLAVGGWRLAPTSLVALATTLAACASQPQPAATSTPSPVVAAPTANPQPPTVASRDTFDRAKRPDLPPPPAVSLPPIETRTLANGMKIVVVQQHELPLADFVLLVGTGAEADPANRPGLATFTARPCASR